jgi:hypothetical protein
MKLQGDYDMRPVSATRWRKAQVAEGKGFPIFCPLADKDEYQNLIIKALLALTS